MKFFILFFLPIIVNCEKFIWNGSEHSFEVTQEIYQDKYLPIFYVSIHSLLTKKLFEPIDVLDHITFINVPILTVNVTGYVSNLRGFDMVLSKRNKTYLNQYYGINIENKSFFTKDRLSNCGLLYCNVGLYLLHDTIYPIEIVKRKITDFKGAFYLKFMTNEMELIFNKFYIYGERYPLIICPYKRWVSIYSGVVFQPYDENGIVNENFYDTHIILPAYQRKKNLTRFVCGDIIYADKTKLRIIYKFAKIDYHYTQIFLTSTISENLVCSENDKPSMYYHFAYNEDDRNMRYIGKNETRYEPIYYGELIYMYNKNNEKLKILQEEMSIVDRNTTITIEPKCINRLGNLPGTLNLYVDEKLVKFDKLSQIKRTGYLYITNEMLNKVYNIKCKIDIGDKTAHPYMSNYYDKELETLFVKQNSNKADQKFTNLTFKEKEFDNYGKYQCLFKKIQKRYNQDLKFYIKNLSIIILPKLNNIEEIWDDINTIEIYCLKKISNVGTLYDMITNLGGINVYQLKNDNTMFKTHDTNIYLINDKVVELYKNIKNIQTTCIYKTDDGIKFEIVKDGVIKLNEFLKKINEQKFAKLTKYFFFRILLFCILFIVPVIVVIIVIVLHSKKKHLKKKAKVVELIPLSENNKHKQASYLRNKSKSSLSRRSFLDKSSFKINSKVT